jgi:O-antigen ligase
MLGQQNAIKTYVPTLFFWVFGFFILVQYLVSAPFVTTFSFYALVLPLLACFIYVNRAQFLFREPIVLGFLLLFTFIVVHVAIFSEGPKGKWILAGFSTALFFFSSVCFFSFVDRRFFDRFLLLVVCCAAAGSAFSVGRYVLHDHVLYPRLLPIGRADHEILGALVYGLAGITCLYLWQRTAKWYWHSMLVVIVLLIGIMILLTQSRTPIAVYGFCISAGLLLFSKKPIRVLGLVAIASLGFAIFLLFNPSLQLPLKHIFVSLLERGDSYRLFLWQQAIEKIQQHPWFGNGMQTRLISPIGSPSAYNPHNIYLATALYLGIPCALVFIFLIGWCVYFSLQAILARRKKGILAALFLCQGLLSGITDHAQLVKVPGPLWLIFWLPIGFVIGEHVRALRTK